MSNFLIEVTPGTSCKELVQVEEKFQLRVSPFGLAPSLPANAMVDVDTHE
jgi:hypothetical protein